MNEDILFTLDLMLRTDRGFYTIPAYMRIYNYNEASMTHSVKTEELLDSIDSFDEMMNIIDRLNDGFKRDMYASYIPVYYSFIFQLAMFEKGEVMRVLKRLHKTQEDYKQYSASVSSLYKVIYTLIDKECYQVTWLLMMVMHLLYDTRLFIRLFRFKNFRSLSDEEYNRLRNSLPDPEI